MNEHVNKLVNAEETLGPRLQTAASFVGCPQGHCPQCIGLCVCVCVCVCACVNLLEDHVVKCWVWGCKIGASRSEVNCSPKEINTYVWEEEDSGAEKAGLAHQWPR